MLARRAAVVAVWAATLAGVAVIVALVPGAGALTWLALALGLAVVAGMVAQLVVGEQHGFVLRLAASTSGSFLLVCAGAVVALAAA